MVTSSTRVYEDHVLTHQFIRVFGRRPNPQELEQYLAAKPRRRPSVRRGVRRRAAHLITRM
jgi:hypothetical protein